MEEGGHAPPGGDWHEPLHWGDAPDASETERFVHNVRPVPWDVLGCQLTSDGPEIQRAPRPDPGVAYVDETGLPQVQSLGPRGAEGAAAKLYAHLGIQDEEAFPLPVRQAIGGALEAKMHKYRGRDGYDQQVIHVVGPDLREEHFVHGDWEDIYVALALAYGSLLMEFVHSGLSRLRLAPLCAGANGGQFGKHLPALTVEGLLRAFESFDEDVRRKLIDAASIELCIFAEDDVGHYKEAFKPAMGATRGAGWFTPPPTGSHADFKAEDPLAGLSPEEKVDALQLQLGDQPGTGVALHRAGEILTPRRSAPDTAKVTSMEALHEEVRRKQRLSPRGESSPRVEDPWEAAAAEPVEVSSAHRTLTFDNKWKAKAVHVSPDHSTASWRTQRLGGFAFSLEPLRKHVLGRWFEIEIVETDVTEWADGLGIGIIRKPDWETMKVHADSFGNLDGFACELFPEHWLLGYDGVRLKIHGVSRYLTSAEMPLGRWKPADLRQGDVVGLLVTPDGHMMLFVNEVLTLLALSCEGLDKMWGQTVFAALDLDGCIKTVKFLQTNSAIPRNVLKAHALFRENENKVKGRTGKPLHAGQPTRRR